MLRRTRAALGAAALLSGLAVAPASAGAATRGPSDGLHRGHGWYDADLRIPEPPLALALVIIGAAAMRLRDRRRALGESAKRRPRSSAGGLAARPLGRAPARDAPPRVACPLRSGEP